MDGGGEHHGADTLGDIGRLLAVGDLRSPSLQMLCQLRLPGVRAADGKPLVHENLRQPAHADASDSDEMDVARMFEIYLIHILFPFPVIRYVFVCFPYNYIKVRRKCHMKL